MNETERVQRWRQRLREEGKAQLTIWLEGDEKRRLEGLAHTWRCSPSELVQRALAAFHPGSPTVPATVTDTKQLRVLIQQELATSCVVTATVTAKITDTVRQALPLLVREILQEQEETRPVADTVTAIVTDIQAIKGEHPERHAQEKVALVARLHQMQAQGMSLGKIAAQLQAEGVPTLSGGGRWYKQTVGNLLKGK